MEDMQTGCYNKKEIIYKPAGGPGRLRKVRNLSYAAGCFMDPALYVVLKESHMCYVHISKVFDNDWYVIKMQIVYGVIPYHFSR